MSTDAPKFAGFYRGVVVSNVDPEGLNKLLVSVDDVLGADPCIWASPAAGLAGLQMTPQINSGVWVHFENGDIDRAVWTGFWRGGLVDVPAAAQQTPPGVPQIVMGTPTQNFLLITDAPGPTGGIQIQLHGPEGPYIKLNETGIEIAASPAGPAIRVTTAGIDLANGALTILPAA
jgi:type VI secretion system (T6SS) baseplate-like injector VgrG